MDLFYMYVAHVLGSLSTHTHVYTPILYTIHTLPDAAPQRTFKVCILVYSPIHTHTFHTYTTAIFAPSPCIIFLDTVLKNVLRFQRRFSVSRFHLALAFVRDSDVESACKVEHYESK